MIHRLLGFTLMTILLAGCSGEKVEVDRNAKPVVYSVNYPLAYFAERVAGDQIEVVFPEMEGDPAFWEPTPEQVAEFQKADLILLNGAEYAKWLSKVSLPENKLINTADGLEEKFIALNGAETHTHGPGGAHVHGDIAFTLWLNLEMAAHQAQEVQGAISAEIELDAGALELLLADLQKLDAELEQVFTPLKSRPLVGSHPVYQYLEQRYGLNMKSVHWEPDSEPDDAMWRELADILETHKADVMLWEDEPLPQVKKALAEKGIKSVVFNPCGNRPEKGDFMTVMQANVEAVKGLQ